MEEWSEQRVKEFLISNEFKEDVLIKFKDYNGKKLKDLSKDDCKEILDTSNGIALFNCIKNYNKHVEGKLKNVIQR
jgi:5'(3')-deoxyribonucleotidase